MSANTQIVSASADDYDAFARLFVELATGDPIPSRDTWLRGIAPTTFFVLHGSDIAGYAYYNVLEDMGYVRHVAVGPTFRRMGIGRLIMKELASRFRERNVYQWCLNVKPDNVPAIRLYRSFGFARVYASCAFRFSWDAVSALPTDPSSLEPLTPNDDARVEAKFHLPRGQIAELRKRQGWIILGFAEAGEPVAFAGFDPAYPGAFPFRMARPTLARPVLEALRPHRSPAPYLQILVEDNPALHQLLVDTGAETRLLVDHYRGHISETP